MYKFLLAVILFCWYEAQSQLSALDHVEWKTIEGTKINVDLAKLSVFVFLSPDCPLSQKYTLALNGLAKEFEKEVRFYGVFAETKPEMDEYKKFKNKYQILFPLLVDKKKRLVKDLTATVTPEAFVLQKGKMLYHGAIDDWAIELGKMKKVATVSFLRNAIQCGLNNAIPFPNYNKPVGCFIE